LPTAPSVMAVVTGTTSEVIMPSSAPLTIWGAISVVVTMMTPEIIFIMAAADKIDFLYLVLSTNPPAQDWVRNLIKSLVNQIHAASSGVQPIIATR